jgi:hypothetical protein
VKAKPAQQGGNGLMMIVIAAAVFFVYQSRGSSPDVKPNVPDVPVTALALEIREALKSQPPGTAESYAAYYDQCAAVLDVEAATIVPQLRQRMIKAKELLQLSGSPEFSAIVSRELDRFAEGAVDRVEYAAAFRSFSDACRKAEK